MDISKCLDKKIMFTLSCKDVGVDCDHVCNAETEEELMEKAKQHAIQDNHFSEEEISRPETQNKIRSFIKST
jgi:predicted small metal-binding protein